jgi:hypothetical protein
MMTRPALPEPEQIPQDCAAKLRPVETSGMFTAILGFRGVVRMTVVASAAVIGRVSL